VGGYRKDKKGNQKTMMAIEMKRKVKKKSVEGKDQVTIGLC
jgi:hypothetical protein